MPQHDDVTGIRWPIWRVRRDGCQELLDPVVVEEPLTVVVNGQPLAILMRTPGQERELAVGFCLSEGYVRRPADVLLVHHCLDEEQARNRVLVRVAPEGFHPPRVMRTVHAACGASFPADDDRPLPTVASGVRVEAGTILDLGRAMREQQVTHKRVGGTHSAALFDTAGQMVVLAEDIGRHNAVDKAIGHCALWDIPLDDKVLVTSGRASYEMAVKAIRAGIPILATLSAPTSLAVQVAQTQGLTLIGYLRGGRMNVYTRLERVATQSLSEIRSARRPSR